MTVQRPHAAARAVEESRGAGRAPLMPLRGHQKVGPTASFWLAPEPLARKKAPQRGFEQEIQQRLPGMVRQEKARVFVSAAVEAMTEGRAIGQQQEQEEEQQQVQQQEKEQKQQQQQRGAASSPARTCPCFAARQWVPPQGQLKLPRPQLQRQLRARLLPRQLCRPHLRRRLA